MQLSAQQEQGVKRILQWFRSSDRKPWFLVEGPAGSGKSACITATTQHIDGKVVYIAPTARAALVMASKGCPDPMTIHSAIYKPKGMSGNRVLVELLRDLVKSPGDSSLKQQIKPLIEKEREGLSKLYASDLERNKEARKPKRLADIESALRSDISNAKDLIVANPMFELNPESTVRDAKLIVMDECSMTSVDTMEDILSFGVPVLLQGDRHQLPPVGGQSWFKGKTPDHSLTEVHRQAKDSPIIYLATLAREGKPLPVGWHGNCLVTRESSDEAALAADRILLGTHKRRWAVNDRVRMLKGYTSPFPEVGERVACKHNDKKVGVMNGEIYTVTSSTTAPSCVWLAVEDGQGGYWPSLKCHKEYFLKQEPNPYTKGSMICMDTGWSQTVHSSQGSEFPSVYLIDESRSFKQDASRWLYTGTSRASKQLTVRLP